MSRENKSKYALMGILSICPMSGYGIKKTIGQSLSYFWNESYGQIYPMLHSLVAEGLATVSKEPGNGKPDRNIYALTNAGWTALRAWLARPPEHEVVRNELLLKLFLGRQMPQGDTIRNIEEFGQLQLSLLRSYDAVEQWLAENQATSPDLDYWLMTLSYGRHVSRALVEWSKETLVVLETKGKVDDGQETIAKAGR